MQEIDHGGKLELGHNVKIGYFAQNQAQLLDEEMTVFETIDHVVGDIHYEDTRHPGSFHVRRRGIRQESEGALGR